MERSIPFVKIGAHVRFLKPEIDRWLLERNRRPVGKAAAKDGAVKAESWRLPFEDKEQVI
jgi:hypothetical protein